MKLIKKIIKRFIYAAFLLYGYNLISVEFNLMVPINFFNLIMIMFLGPFGLISLILFKYLILWGLYG